jgi:hypothetical protein
VQVVPQYAEGDSPDLLAEVRDREVVCLTRYGYSDLTGK